MRHVFLIALAMLICQGMSAQNALRGISVKCQVVDSAEQKGIPYATVSLFHMPDSLIEWRGVTDGNGKISFTTRQSGDYLLTVTSIGFSTLHVAFRADSTALNLGVRTMTPGGQTLGEVSIVGEKPLVRTEADKVIYNAEADPESKTSNALDMLRKVPMVTVDGEDNITLNGSSSYKIFINGKPSTMLSNNAKDVLKGMPASTIKDVEIITSPGAKYDAEGVGGIINIVTTKKTVDGYTGTVNAGAGTGGSANAGLYAAMARKKLSASLNFGNWYFQGPATPQSYERTNLADPLTHYTRRTGSQSFSVLSLFINTELSYEIDTLNLITMSFQRWQGQFEGNGNTETQVFADNDAMSQHYSTSNLFKGLHGGSEGHVDFQHTFPNNKNRILTLSYKFSTHQNGSDARSEIDSIFNFANSRLRSNNKAIAPEHTLQADYVQPIGKKHTLETGLKGILRKNVSATDYYDYDYDLSSYFLNANRLNDLDHTQRIAAIYASYQLKLQKWALKTGVRAEYTDDFILITEQLSDTVTRSYPEIVPSASLSYQISQEQSLRLSYNMRISRPHIWYLNPRVNDTDPKYISYGNPTLDPERTHSIELNYGLFKKTFNINITPSYSFSNNSIEQVVSLKDNDVLHSTYENAGKIHRTGISFYGSVRPGKNFNLMVNGNLTYNSIESLLSSTTANEGWSWRVYSNFQYSLNKGLKISANGMYSSPRLTLQGKSGGYYFMSLSLQKNMLKDKFTASATLYSPFWKYLEYRSKSASDNFEEESVNRRLGRTVSINLSYRFGELKNGVKRVRRGINNDDVKPGENGTSGGGGTGGGQ